MTKFGKTLSFGLLAMALVGTMLVAPGTANAGPGDNSTYFSVRRDYRKCMYPMCGGYWVQRVNRNRTRCADGKFADECYVAELDWSGTGIADSQHYEATTAPGMLLRGKVVAAVLAGFDSSVFEATEVWTAATDAEPSGWFVRMQDSGIVCITTPCPSYDESVLNRMWSWLVEELWLDSVGATDAQIEAAYNDVFTSEGGLIAAGNHYWFYGPAGWGIGLDATQFYRYMAPAACQSTGCSGHICSDEAVVSTCEWLPEYACIRQQSCELQADGACGWTPTAESEACWTELDEPGSL